MINKIIAWSIQQRVLVLLATVVVVLGGLVALQRTPVDAIPDLSDVQVIVKTPFPGQAPQVVEDQVTYPLSNLLLGIPGAKTVRAYSFMGDSYVYVIFDDSTDVYWARSRISEYLSQASTILPAGVQPQIGPDATGVGWIYQYAITDSSNQHDLADLTRLQDWFIKQELQSVEGVAEVAKVGGMVKQYQIVVDPEALRRLQIPITHIVTAVQRNNQSSGASVIEQAGAEHMVQVLGYIDSIDDIKNTPLGLSANGLPVLVKDIASVTLGPLSRRGVADFNGQGDVVGGIIVMRSGGDAQRTIDAVKAKLATIESSLPPGVTITSVYDRSQLIERAVTDLSTKLLQEFIVIALVCAVFLFHLRSSLVAIISLPVALLLAFMLMYAQGISANIMSLGGIAIAIGAMVDASIVMVENLHKHLAGQRLERETRWQHVYAAVSEVAPAIFFGLAIITVSFFPVFALQAQEGRLFGPLAFTKSYAMAASAFLAITLVPVLIGYLMVGKIPSEAQNPVNSWLQRAYRPMLTAALQHPKTTLASAALILLSALWPLSQLGSEFMPDLDEGDIMYMPTFDPGISIGEARLRLQQAHRLIKTVPEVESVFGKAGRAETATDPAPLSMIESVIRLKPKSQWRDGISKDDIIQELRAAVNLPGFSNAFVMPIKTRIDMLATGIKTPVGVKIAGPDLEQLQAVAADVEGLLNTLEHSESVYAERPGTGRYLNIRVDAIKAGQYGLSTADVQQQISVAVGGKTIAYSLEGRERYPVNARYPQGDRDSLADLKTLLIATPNQGMIELQDVAEVMHERGAAMLKSENARLNAWVYIDVKDTDLGSYVTQAQALLDQELNLPPGYTLSWAGQYQYMQRALERLKIIVPITLAIIVALLLMQFKSMREVLLLLLTLPLSLVGSAWLLYGLGFNLSVAVGVGFIALAGLSIEIGILMLVYLQQSVSASNSESDTKALNDAIIEGASRRVRPILMTASSVFIGMLPILLGEGTGVEVMSRIAAPMVGGVVSTLVLTLIVLPVLYRYLLAVPAQR
ncbi:Cobalt-zinc-cadmium resistance protein CzcA; Cation efflux system protein CusA [Aequoribacter fuscus]|uniref:Cobalt-zinc-cadmium resistance protein CzcA Cation efflux system protein CusA n=1 Tax=Aequoribacter fuscus TaxID=2518989 RepID=F3L4G3_9GAMM|nr:CusA/CzcA family heavy metal efflux RND transporter [Aequoribacter fuscus]EGG28778.1 Cobalt-zinc-cadmium resistance protein CzcA; Cation efflux system protein CusA [Aequoribacter fuscus]QHJ87392.1 efflux RND transporter permease subunit [Aequoribacter fuscus]